MCWYICKLHMQDHAGQYGQCITCVQNISKVFIMHRNKLIGMLSSCSSWSPSSFTFQASSWVHRWRILGQAMRKPGGNTRNQPVSFFLRVWVTWVISYTEIWSKCGCDRDASSLVHKRFCHDLALHPTSNSRILEKPICFPFCFQHAFHIGLNIGYSQISWFKTTFSHGLPIFNSHKLDPSP